MRYRRFAALIAVGVILLMSLAAPESNAADDEIVLGPQLEPGWPSSDIVAVYDVDSGGAFHYSFNATYEVVFQVLFRFEPAGLSPTYEFLKLDNVSSAKGAVKVNQTGRYFFLFTYYGTVESVRIQYQLGHQESWIDEWGLVLILIAAAAAAIAVVTVGILRRRKKKGV